MAGRRAPASGPRPWRSATPAWTPGTCATCRAPRRCRLLPQSIGVDARAFLSERAPDLSVDHMVRLLERRAAQLEPLWDAWGQVRPILLSERQPLEAMA